jgi:GTP:adenosylcobinamide-phosphate guanylyltransferase
METRLWGHHTARHSRHGILAAMTGSQPPAHRLQHAVLLGGGSAQDPLAIAHGVASKALVPIHGHAMAWYVLQALRAAGLDHIVYLGPTTPEVAALVDVVLPDAGSILGNLEAGLSHAPKTGRVLISTTDVPLLGQAALDDLLGRAGRELASAALIYPVVHDHDAERDFPGGKRTYVRLRDGRFTGGNLFILEPSLVGRFMPQLRVMVKNRKNPLALARTVGFGTLWGLLTGSLTVAALERRVSEILGLEARALITPFAEIGFDVDKAADLALVSAKLSAKLSAQASAEASAGGGS